jgi:hypothetical protein
MVDSPSVAGTQFVVLELLLEVVDIREVFLRHGNRCTMALCAFVTETAISSSKIQVCLEDVRGYLSCVVLVPWCRWNLCVR